MKKLVAGLGTIIMVTLFVAGCGSNDLAQNIIISNEKLADIGAVEETMQPEDVKAGQAIYANIHFIESPNGSKYMVKWMQDGKEIKNETKQTHGQTEDVVCYELEANKAVAGKIKVQVYSGDALILTKEITIG